MQYNNLKGITAKPILKQDTHLGESSGLSHDLTPSLGIDFCRSKRCIIHVKDQFSILSAELSDFLTSPRGSEALNNSVISSVRIHLQPHITSSDHTKREAADDVCFCFLAHTLIVHWIVATHPLHRSHPSLSKKKKSPIVVGEQGTLGDIIVRLFVFDSWQGKKNVIHSRCF